MACTPCTVARLPVAPAATASPSLRGIAVHRRTGSPLDSARPLAALRSGRTGLREVAS
jgi:hypothetical protein